MADEATPIDTSTEAAAEAFTGLLSGKQPASERKQAAEQTSGPDDDADGAERSDERQDGPDDTESDGADAKGADNSTDIAAPSSMPEELKASFAKLPPDLQKFVVDRERD